MLCESELNICVGLSIVEACEFVETVGHGEVWWPTFGMRWMEVGSASCGRDVEDLYENWVGVVSDIRIVATYRAF